MTTSANKPRRGRPPKVTRENHDTKAELIRSGLEQLTECGFASSGIEPILKKVGVPKGSFYHYFASKEAFGESVIAHYDRYFSDKLDMHLLNTEYSPLKRLQNFVDDAVQGMTRHDFKRGCLVGNLGQEVDALPSGFRSQLTTIFMGWQQRIETCLIEAQASKEVAQNADCTQAAEFFWIGWEGAVSRAKLVQNAEPLRLFIQYFLHALPK
ncbi:acrylate utilization transcriptional regulator AcuR [Paraglaciecola arctica]|uniref:acrylate utilization transcriptional regulator AcuR n=1 Tax=Paraglaciecola arctica TaxID=1128911 RepID=UPI001C06FB70|nr:TetR/AcrR family transcriptional regulator [Paraglaciecola arctica]MBU3003176.1 TetR/AcrR family transcriptional regulator [Paraglaciecola arctica]